MCNINVCSKCGSYVDGSLSFCHCAISVIAHTIFDMFMHKTAEMLVLQSLKFRGQNAIELDLLLLSMLSPGISLGILSQTLSLQFLLL